jgi:hypothetical protein
MNFTHDFVNSFSHSPYFENAFFRLTRTYAFRMLAKISSLIRRETMVRNSRIRNELNEFSQGKEEENEGGRNDFSQTPRWFEWFLILLPTNNP